jgi:hypothetical protein
MKSYMMEAVDWTKRTIIDQLIFAEYQSHKSAIRPTLAGFERIHSPRTRLVLASPVGQPPPSSAIHKGKASGIYHFFRD